VTVVLVEEGAGSVVVGPVIPIVHAESTTAQVAVRMVLFMRLASPLARSVRNGRENYSQKSLRADRSTT
jgi:hypothetical protein